MVRAFSASWVLLRFTYADGIGWYGVGPLARSEGETVWFRCRPQWPTGKEIEAYSEMIWREFPRCRSAGNWPSTSG